MLHKGWSKVFRHVLEYETDKIGQPDLVLTRSVYNEAV